MDLREQSPWSANLAQILSLRDTASSDLSGTLAVLKKKAASGADLKSRSEARAASPRQQGADSNPASFRRKGSAVTKFNLQAPQTLPGLRRNAFSAHGIEVLTSGKSLHGA